MGKLLSVGCSLTFGLELAQLYSFRKFDLESMIVPIHRDSSVRRHAGTPESYIIEGENDVCDKVFLDSFHDIECNEYRRSHRWGALLAEKMGLEEVCVSRPGNSNHSMSTDMGRYFSNRKKREEVEYVVVQLTFSDRGFVPSRGKHLYDLRYPIDVMNSMYSSSGELSDHYFEGGGYLNAAYTYERLRTTATLGDLSENKYTLNDEIKREGKLIKDFYRNISKCKDEYHNVGTWQALWAMSGIFQSHNIPYKIFMVRDNFEDTNYGRSLPPDLILDDRFEFESLVTNPDNYKYLTNFPGFCSPGEYFEVRNKEGIPMASYGTHLSPEGHQYWADIIFEHINK